VGRRRCLGQLADLGFTGYARHGYVVRCERREKGIEEREERERSERECLAGRCFRYLGGYGMAWVSGVRVQQGVEAEGR